MINIKEAQTRKDLIDPKLADAGWDTSNQDIKVICEYPIAPGKIEGQGRKRNPKSADYVLEYVSFAIKPMGGEERVAKSQDQIFDLLDDKQKEFLEFVLSKYIESGVEELDQEKLPDLIKLKYETNADAKEKLGDLRIVKENFIGFQHLCQRERLKRLSSKIFPIKRF